MNESKLRIVGGGVKFGERAERADTWRQRSLPYPLLELIAECRKLPTSTASRVLLAEILSGVGLQGRGQGCGPGEAMDKRRDQELLKVLRCSRAALARQKVELRRLRVLRVVRVNPRCPLPDFRGTGDVFTSKPAADGKTTSVYYVELDVVRRILGLPSRPAPMLQKASAKASTTTFRVISEAAIAPLDSGIVAELEAYWYERLGRSHGATAATRARVRRALEVALSVHDDATLRAVIDGRSDAKLGGREFEYCEKLGIWDERLFAAKDAPSKITDRMFREVATSRERAQPHKATTAAAPAQADYCDVHGWRCRWAACKGRRAVAKG